MSRAAQFNVADKSTTTAIASLIGIVQVIVSTLCELSTQNVARQSNDKATKLIALILCKHCLCERILNYLTIAYEFKVIIHTCSADIGGTSSCS
jgi:hypothetical protein